MTTKTTITALALAVLLSAPSFAPPPASAEVIDRIIATVNGRVILQSDWDEALCYEALLTNRTWPNRASHLRRRGATCGPQ